MRTVNLAARNYVRSAIACAVSDAPDRYAGERWGWAPGTIMKAFVAALNSNEIGSGPTAFFSLVYEASILARLGLRRVVPHVRTLSVTGGSRGFWVPDGSPLPFSSLSLAGSTLRPLSIGALVAMTDESLRDQNSLTEDQVEQDLTGAISQAIDLAFLDRANSGVIDEKPASVTHSAVQISATSDPVADIANVISAFSGDLSKAVFVTDPKLAARLAGIRDGTGFVYPAAGARGGELAGIPLITTVASPIDSTGSQIALIDGSGIAFAGESVSLEKSRQASVAMSDTPDATPQMISLWATNTVAFKSIVRAVWSVQRPGSVAVLTDVTW